MNDLSNIQFYAVCKVNRRGKNKRLPCSRKETKSILFEEKVKRIKQLSKYINKRL